MSACKGAPGSPFGGGMRSHMASSSSGTPSPVLAETRNVSDAGTPRTASISAAAALGVGGRQVDLVEGDHYLEVVLEGEVSVGEGLGLDALGGVHQQHHSFAGGEAAAHFVTEVHVAGGVDQVDGIALPVDADVLGLDRDPPLSLDVHRVEVLLAHIAGVDGAR